MTRAFIKWVMNTIAIILAVKFVPGIVYSGEWWGILIVGMIFGLVNTVIRPLIKNKSISSILRVEDDFIHRLLVQDLSRSLLDVLERFKQLRNTARILNVHLEGIDDKIE